MKKKNRHIGSTFEFFLEEEGIRNEIEALAIERVLARKAAAVANKPPR